MYATCVISASSAALMASWGFVTRACLNFLLLQRHCKLEVRHASYTYMYTHALDVHPHGSIIDQLDVHSHGSMRCSPLSSSYSTMYASLSISTPSICLGELQDSSGWSPMSSKNSHLWESTPDGTCIHKHLDTAMTKTTPSSQWQWCSKGGVVAFKHGFANMAHC